MAVQLIDSTCLWATQGLEIAIGASFEQLANYRIHMGRIDRHNLHFGPYRTPRFRYGDKVLCEARGEVVIRRLSSGRIAWPVGVRTYGTGLVLYKDLVRAVRREAGCAVAYWWGVDISTVTSWRHALGVEGLTEGDRLLKAAYASRPAMKRMFADIGRQSNRNPLTRAKISAANRGKPKPPGFGAAISRARKGRKPPPEVGRKISATKKRLGQQPVCNNPAWSAEEDELLRTLPTAEVAKRTGRTMKAVNGRRYKLALETRQRQQAAKRKQPAA